MSKSHRRLRLVVVPALLAAMVLAGCGSEKESGAGSTNAKHTVKLALIAPLSGSLSALGLGMKNSIDLAVKQANDAGKIKDWRVEFDPEDDTAKADVGAQVASKVASDAAVAGVIGTLNSSVALQVAPILQKSNIVMISPANSGVTLTGRDKIPNQTRPYSNYFRVCATDDLQGPFDANFVFDTLGFKKVALVHDKKVYGQGLAEAFKGQFEKKGGTISGTETINPGDKDFSGVITKIKPQGAQLLFYGGEYPEASLLSSQMKAAGLNIPLMGGDGIVDKTYITNAGPAAQGDYASNFGAPTETLDTAKKFVADYAAGGYKEGFSAYGAYAFDAANVIINAFDKVLTGKSKIDDKVRQDIIKAVQDSSMDGATGKVSFDKFGDATAKVLTVYKVSGTDFKAEKTAEFSA